MSLKLHLIFPKTFFQFLKIFLKITRNFNRNVYKIYLKNYFLFPRISFLIFLKIFKYVFNFFPSVTQDFFTFTLLQNFSQKLLQNFSVFPNFTKNFRILTSALKWFATVFQNFFTTYKNSKLHCYVCKAPPRKLKVFLKFY